jgi:hypothetical protein
MPASKPKIENQFMELCSYGLSMALLLKNRKSLDTHRAIRHTLLSISI